MPRDAVKTLFHPFATGVLSAPGEGESVFFLGAEPGFQLPEGFAATLVPVQGFRPHHLALEAQRLSPMPVSQGDGYAAALILMTRHRGENEAMIADALARVNQGGMIVVAGAKEDGVQSFRKRIASMGVETEHLAKYHAQAFWFTRPDNIEPLVAAFGKRSVAVAARFQTSPGMFSHQDVDPGSAFLVRYLPKEFRGQAADFGAGWGYLSVMLAEVSPQLEGIDLFEADHASLEAARQNIAFNCPSMPTRFFWQDLNSEDVRSKYDLVVMNPPFHGGHATEPQLGQAMIKAAAKALKIGGQLVMVANRGLPYEEVLAANFKAHGETARNARFKVLWARK